MLFSVIKRFFKFENIIASAACSLISLGVFASSLSAAPIKVSIDEAEVVEFKRPVHQIIIGNPAIADVTVQSPNILVFTGRSIGHTNIILLDENNRRILNRKVHVSTSQESGLVMVYRGTQRASYHCGPICNPRIAVGDNKNFTKDVADNTSARLKSTSAAVKGD